MARLVGTVTGALLAAIVLAFVTSITVLVVMAGGFAVLNGLFKETQLGRVPLFYTGTILLLYTANDVASGTSNILERVAYNVVGIVIAVFVVVYPFPVIMKRLNPQTTISR